MEAIKIARPIVIVHYENKNITAYIMQSLIEVNYIDFVDDGSDCIELVFEDDKQRWQNTWYPQYGDQIQLQIGYEEGPLLPCGIFEIDQVELVGPPAVIRIRALAAGIKSCLRTHQSRTYEETTLAAIVATVAQRHQLEIAGHIEPIKILRLTQIDETDLSFLKRVAQEFGYSFSVRNRLLCFFKRTQLKATQPTLFLERANISTYRFRDKGHHRIATTTLSYHDARAKKTRKYTATEGPSKSNQQSTHKLKICMRAENDQQAKLKANAAYDLANEEQTTAILTGFGNVKLIAGVNLQLTDFGAMNGKYMITQSHHRLMRSTGYTTEIEIKRVREPSPEKTLI